MTASSNVTRYLDNQSIRYEIDHHRACFSADGLAATEHVSRHHVAKSVVCIVDDVPVILVLPASLQVDLAAVGEAFNASTVRLADPHEMRRRFPEVSADIAPAPLPIWGDVPILADVAIVGADQLVFAAGTPNDAVRMSGADWLAVCRPIIGCFATTECIGLQ